MKCGICGADLTGCKTIGAVRDPKKHKKSCSIIANDQQLIDIIAKGNK
jgi:hypothetical protein